MSFFIIRNTTNAFDQHSLIGAVATVSAIVIAVGKPIAAKFADVLGRTEVRQPCRMKRLDDGSADLIRFDLQAWTIAIVLYTIGYIILAACQNVGGYAAGWLIRSAGYAAVQILMQVCPRFLTCY